MAVTFHQLVLFGERELSHEETMRLLAETRIRVRQAAGPSRRPSRRLEVVR